MTGRWARFCMLAGLLVVGCANWRPGPELPMRNSLVLDQLVVFSDTTLPQNHRLLAELRALRTIVSTKLALPISDEPIHVYLFPTPERFEAFMAAQYPALPRRRAFFVETDTRLSVYAYWGDRVAEDLRHEVVHGYLHSVVRNLPLWLDEGLAEYFEVPRGLSGLNKPHLEQLLAESASGWKPDVARLDQLRAMGDMTQRDYAESWAWVHFLLEGPAPRQQLLRNYLQSLVNNAPQPALGDQLLRAEPQAGAALLEHLQVLRQTLP